MRKIKQVGHDFLKENSKNKVRNRDNLVSDGDGFINNYLKNSYE